MVFRKFKRNKALNFFVHIPKTAGTSFRKGIESISKVANHYKVKKEITSELVKKEVIENKDHYSFLNSAKSEGFRWISGHVPISEYLAIIDPRNIVTFVREPVERTYSLFAHYSSHSGYKKNFCHFIRENRFINSQSKVLKGLPLELIGVVGITKEYAKSLNIINGHLNLKLSAMKENVNASDNYLEQALQKNIKKEILELNKKDIKLYQKALWLHQERIKFTTKGVQWVYATASQNKGGDISGLAWYAKSDEAVEIGLFIDGKLHQKEFANKLYHGVLKAKLPRLGFVSYKFNIDSAKFKGGDATVVALESGQVINFSKITLK